MGLGVADTLLKVAATPTLRHLLFVVKVHGAAFEALSIIVGTACSSRERELAREGSKSGDWKVAPLALQSSPAGPATILAGSFMGDLA